MRSSRRVGRAAVVLLGVLFASLTVAWLAAPVVTGAASDVVTPGGDPATAVASAVTLVAASALAVIAGWVAVCTTWCVVSALHTGRTPRAVRAHALLRPWLVRVLVGAALGTTAVAAPTVAASPASTVPQDATSTPSAPTPDTPNAEGPPARATGAGTLSLPRALAGLSLPDRPIGAAPAPQHAPPTADAPRQAHTVTTGESLWSIAADHLPPGAPPAAVDRWWRAVYDANRPGIGDDPDLIRPGTVLRLPRPLA